MASISGFAKNLWGRCGPAAWRRTGTDFSSGPEALPRTASARLSRTGARRLLPPSAYCSAYRGNLRRKRSAPGNVRRSGASSGWPAHSTSAPSFCSGPGSTLLAFVPWQNPARGRPRLRRAGRSRRCNRPLQSIAMVRALYGRAKCPHVWAKTPRKLAGQPRTLLLSPRDRLAELAAKTKLGQSLSF